MKLNAQKFFVFFMLFFLCSSTQAQIKREIYGVTLGKTTKKEVASFLRRQGHYLFDETNNSIVCKMKFSYAGLQWDAIHYDFYNNVLSTVVLNKAYKKEDISNSSSDYKRLRENLYTKYVKRKPTDNSGDFKPVTKVKDNKTLITLTIWTPDKNPWIKVLKLSYEDLSLSKKSANQAIDDL